MSIQATISYSDVNPLLMPKILTKPVFAKEFILEKPAPKEEDEEVQRSALEEELRQTLNDLDLALNSTEVCWLNKHNLFI